MSESNKDENINKEDNKLSSKKESNHQNDEISIEEKLKNSEENFLDL